MASCLFATLSLSVAQQANILFVLTDDQDVYMDGAKHQPKISRLLAEEGSTLTNSFASTPVCCPSRAGMLTGRYIHHVPIKNNSLAGNCSGPAWNAGPEKDTIGVHMQALGYLTSFAGKYLNRYGEPGAGGVEHVPPGWDEWNGLVGNSVYYNYTLSHNGKAEHHGDDYATDYLTDLLSNRTAQFLRGQWAHQAQVEGDAPRKKPFFAMVSTPACHGPREPAPQYAYTLTHTAAAPAVRTPNYGVGAAGKHWVVQAEAAQWRADAARRSAWTDFAHVRRLEALLSVDDLVENLVGVLEELEELAATYIFYTSDHGYHLGQFGLLQDKRMPYEHDIRVPGYVRGPGIPRNTSSSAVIVLIDLVPTFIEIGGGIPPKQMDGRSALALLRAGPSASADRSFLVEYNGEANNPPPNHVCDGVWGPGAACFLDGNEKLAPGPFAGGELCSLQDASNNTYACVRTINASDDTIYCQFDDAHKSVQYYDLATDEWQMAVDAAEQLPQPKRTALAAQLEAMVSS